MSRTFKDMGGEMRERRRRPVLDRERVRRLAVRRGLRRRGLPAPAAVRPWRSRP